MHEEFVRTTLLFEEEQMEKLYQATVMVLGVGGVGSHLIEALARSGVGSFVIVDNDTLSITNINRQSIAYHSTIGQYKTRVMEKRIKDINPLAKVITREMFILPENVKELPFEEVDYIADAIDTVTAKLIVIEKAKEKGIPIISSMGTGNKIYPQMLEITDIKKTSMDPLSKVMRKELKARNIEDLKVIYSKEKPIDTKGRETGEDKGVRRSIPGSTSFVPPVAGIMIAGEIIRDIINKK
ncbi:MAG TPA: tRNA threonylcarbamoyladenosine dehydratase [Candidatus Dorea intestinavium]|nr:tRNA threonylcarbamoyladenosine dehydratase [Candidatus Dorea intestinavium]